MVYFGCRGRRVLISERSDGLMREKLCLAVLTATVSFAVPKVIDLLSQMTLYIIQQLFQ